MGVLGKDLLDIYCSRTHVKVLYGTTGYWVEFAEAPLPYGAVLTELLNLNAAPYLERLATFEETLRTGNKERAVEDYHALGHAFSSLPFFELVFHGQVPVDDILSFGPETAEDVLALNDAAMNKFRWAAEDLTMIQERYPWFLSEMFRKVGPEKKKGQRKKPLAELVYEGRVDAFVSGVSLGGSSQVDAPPVNIQYAVLETADGGHELVEKMYFDRLADFVYVEFMKGLQKGFVPKKCANCGRWFLQEPGMTYAYCTGEAPGHEGVTCREIGSKVSFRAKVTNNGVWEVHQRAYKKYFARTKKRTMSQTDFEAWAREAEKIRDGALPRYEKAGTEEEKKAVVDKLRERLNRL